VFTARYAPSPYIKQIRFVFKGLIINEIRVYLYFTFYKHASFSNTEAEVYLPNSVVLLETMCFHDVSNFDSVLTFYVSITTFHFSRGYFVYFEF
jgi:hypothetical protein